MKLSTSNKRMFLKCAEELNELSLEIIHAVNKVNKNNHGKIKDEMTDVEKYLHLLKIFLDKELQ
jgi:NTP pyrophosphatase (non-canonical NTP hydrolase)